MRNKTWFCLCLAVSTQLLLGCSEEPKTPMSPPPQNQPTSDPTSQHESPASPADSTASSTAMSYDEYSKLYTKLVQTLKFPNFVSVEDNLTTPDIVIVDKDVTFGKREVLTVTGDKSESTPKSTQKRIVFQSKDDGVVLYIDLVYLPKVLDNDLISWDSAVPERLKDVPALNKITQATLSYKNTLVKLELISTTNKAVSLPQMNDLLHQVVEFLQKYSG